MNINQDKAIRTFSPKKVLIAISIGLVATAYLFIQSLNGRSVTSLIEPLSHPNWTWFLSALLVLLVRDGAYAYRIYNLTNRNLSLKGSIYTVLLWEFASAVTPSVVGGTAVAVFILAKEGIKFGKALAYVMLTAILDNTFFLLAAPIVLFSSETNIFAILGERSIFGLPLKVELIFYASYALIALYTLLMAYGLLLNPRAFKWLLLKLTSKSFLRRWRMAAYEQSSEMFLASKELTVTGFRYWGRAILSTIFVWSARYFMLNCIISSFVPEVGSDLFAQIDVFAKQVILWIVQLLSPTPGGSGFAIYFLNLLFQGSTYGANELWLSIGLLWRIFTYYAYLFAGVIIFPKWLRRVSLDQQG